MVRKRQPSQLTERQSVDPLSEAIIRAVENAIDTRLPEMVAAIQGTISTVSFFRPDKPSSERFIAMRDLERILSADRSTIRRRSSRGVYPPLRKIGASIGYFQSDLDVIFLQAR
jgi:predicted DNA-binding transcriptional regulator AlpA